MMPCKLILEMSREWAICCQNARCVRQVRRFANRVPRLLSVIYSWHRYGSNDDSISRYQGAGQGLR
jgi:hypothetical protein